MQVVEYGLGHDEWLVNPTNNTTICKFHNDCGPYYQVTDIVGLNSMTDTEKQNKIAQCDALIKIVDTNDNRRIIRQIISLLKGERVNQFECGLI